jgi:hypothetical protein
MADYWVDDGGDGTAGTSWATAYQSIAALIAAVPAALTTSGNRVFIGDDHNDSVTGANRTFTGPASGLPVQLISCDRTSGASPPAYKVGTGKQLRSDDGSFTLVIDGAFALYGIRIAPGATASPVFQGDANEGIYASECSIAVATNGTVNLGVSLGSHFYKGLTIDLTADGTTNRTGTVITHDSQSIVGINGLSFVNSSYRTGAMIRNGGILMEITGADFSGFTNATACEITDAAGAGRLIISNSITAATWATTSPATATANIEFYNFGQDDQTTYVYDADYRGVTNSSSSIYRTGGATVEGDATGWLITTTANCGEAFPLTTPWIYGLVSSTGSKTFDVYITNDTADFTDAEVWLEVEYLGTADEAQWTLAKDQRATITTTAAAQTDDVTSAWNGAGPAFTYMQKLSVTATVNETGQYRARVCVGVASIAGSRFFYIDPKVTVT